jgi:hypothetical protein
MPPYTDNGHPTSGTTAQRPTNCQIGFRYFDTTIGQTVVYNGTGWTLSTRLPISTVAAAGTTQANAVPVVEGFNLVTGADGSAGVLLPTPVAGLVVTLKNNANAVLKVFPPANCTVNALTANAVFNQPAFTACDLVAYNATAYFSNPLLPS